MTQLILAFCNFANASSKTPMSIPPAVFEPAIPAIERPQTYTLDRKSTGIGFVTSTNLERIPVTCKLKSIIVSEQVVIVFTRCFERLLPFHYA
jgi:hypothetical protein